VRNQVELAQAATATSNDHMLPARSRRSLIVRIGIMNIMLVSGPNARARIGIRLAVGAHGRDVSSNSDRGVILSSLAASYICSRRISNWCR